ncbi:T6SS amidase immunity protein Tai4 family protein [Uliginosibacterium sp. TH139]|uniref:T6SS amidase immunity protein Tai4 family protein n=1 Tax=Uliginosibacterium sp. TH139 TaxID=2067453 RepID=UPI000C7D5D7F|nr:T6SS amidase immunity protein Tai4 family protein [Uliginosibacterium sp. TH139]PLK47313.1 type VI secretion protein [Uliginosibacterium sp. TH139]
MRLALACLCAAASLSCFASAPERKHYTPAQYLKNYALSACIANGFQSGEVVSDALAAANGYKELGSLDIDAYNDAAALGKAFLTRDYLSHEGSEKLILMKCVDLFHSRELNQLARKYAKRK